MGCWACLVVSAWHGMMNSVHPQTGWESGRPNSSHEPPASLLLPPFPGVAVLAFSRTRIFEVYYFRMVSPWQPAGRHELLGSFGILMRGAVRQLRSRPLP